MVTNSKLQEMIVEGRTAIEYRLLAVLARPRALTDTDQMELENLKDLLARYDALMMPNTENATIPDASNDKLGGTEE